jgi:hypothetical protein
MARACRWRRCPVAELALGRRRMTRAGDACRRVGCRLAKAGVAQPATEPGDTMSNVFIAFQTNEETRPIIEAILADNPNATVNEQPAMVKIDAPGRWSCAAKPSRSSIGPRLRPAGAAGQPDHHVGQHRRDRRRIHPELEMSRQPERPQGDTTWTCKSPRRSWA